MTEIRRKKKEDLLRYLANAEDAELREVLLRYLSKQSDAALREILFQLFQSRRPNPEEDQYNRNCFFLGTASSLLESQPGRPQRWGAYQIEAVAYVDRDEYGEEALGPDWGFCQFGVCSQCGTAMRSNYKRGICPLCRAKVYMT